MIPGSVVKLDIQKWQNPVLYLQFNIFVYTYYIDTDGEMYGIDKLTNYIVDLSNAEPKYTLELSVADTFTLTDGSTS